MLGLQPVADNASALLSILWPILRKTVVREVVALDCERALDDLGGAVAVVESIACSIRFDLGTPHSYPSARERPDRRGALCERSHAFRSDTISTSRGVNSSYMVSVWVVTTAFVIATFITVKRRGDKKMPHALRDAIAADAIFGALLLLHSLV